MEKYINQIVYYEGELYKVLNQYKGDEDQSYHGSPWYYDYIEIQNLNTREMKTLCVQKSNFKVATKYIKNLEEKIKIIKKLLSCL